MKEYKSSATDRMRWRRYYARKYLGEDVPYRQPGRPRRGVDDSPYICDAPLSLLAEWMIYQLDQLPPEKDPQQARDYGYFRYTIRSWGAAFARREAETRDKAREIRR
jgi:hypothetical protein